MADAARTLAPQSETVAERFLLAIADTSLVTFQTFDDTPAKRRNLNHVIHGWTQFTAARLRTLNDKGAGVFFMVNEGDGNGRTAANVTGVRALFVDLDGAPLEPALAAPLKPHITVQSSPGRYHAYWRVHGLRLDEFTDLQKRLAEQFDSDPSVCDLPRVLRVPGFVHQKGAPFQTQLLHADDGTFDREQFLREFQIADRKIIVPKKAVTERIPEGKRTVTLLNRARGFVNKGLLQEAVKRRLQAFNANHCEPPLCATEIDAIVTSACAYPSKGKIELPVSLFDSPVTHEMSDAEFRLYAHTLRRIGEGNSETLALPWEDFKHIFGRQKFYRTRARLEGKILEVTRPGGNSKVGKIATIYRVKLP